MHELKLRNPMAHPLSTRTFTIYNLLYKPHTKRTKSLNFVQIDEELDQHFYERLFKCFFFCMQTFNADVLWSRFVNQKNKNKIISKILAYREKSNYFNKTLFVSYVCIRTRPLPHYYIMRNKIRYRIEQKKSFP